MFLIGCKKFLEPSGGGSVHIPPGVILAGKPTTLELELKVWGSGAEKLTSRFKDIQCHYRLEGGRDYKSVTATPVVIEDKRLVVNFTLPQLPDAEKGKRMEYYFDYKFDGVYNRRDEGPVPIE